MFNNGHVLPIGFFMIFLFYTAITFDPGADIVEKAIAQNFSVVPVPGPNAAISALYISLDL